jgi:hypothetical protein
MANNFHDNNGWLIVGIDGHQGLHFPPLVVPVFFWSVQLLHPFFLGTKQKPSVIMNGGHNSVVDEHDPKFLWPHLAFAPDPLDLFIPIDILFGEQKCWLARQSVLIEGEPAAPCAIYGPISVNLDCWEMCALPTSLIVQVGTVQTTPSLDDYLKAALRWVISEGIKAALWFIKGKYKDMAFTKNGITALYKKTQDEIIQKLRDKGEDLMGEKGKELIQKELDKRLDDIKKDMLKKVLWNWPGNKKEAAKLFYDVAKEATGIDPVQAAKDVFQGKGLPEWKGIDWGKGLKKGFESVVPVAEQASTINDLRGFQQQQRESQQKIQQAMQGMP